MDALSLIVADRITCIMLAAFVLDCMLGDPQNPLHPMRMIGGGVGLCVRLCRKTNVKSAAARFAMGAVLTVIVIGLSYAATALITWGLYRLNFWAGLAAEAVLCYFLIAAKALRKESMGVCGALQAGNIGVARERLSFIVGRDTEGLSGPDVVKAAVETISENLTDAVIAPLIFICIGGAPLGMAYKAANTLDSMIGYNNEEFRYFGKFAARLDDAANFIPARVSALFMILGSIFTGADVRGAVRFFLRDRYKHKSPNSAQTESVCAGALGLCLGGDNHYGGVLVHKPVIGDEIHEAAPKHIIAANRLMYAAVIIAVILLSVIRIVFAISRG